MEQRRCYGCMQLITEDICPHCGHSLLQHNEPDQLPAGTLLRGQYLVGKVLGQGGFGITYMGWDSYLDMTVAIKEFYPASAVNRDVTLSNDVHVNTRNVERLYINSRERFLREAKTLAKLRDVPEIVSIHGFFTENNTAYIIMEYVRGTDLRHFVQQRGGKLTPQELLPILEPVVKALGTVHEAGLVHRDISPDNIMLASGGSAKLLDFGAARDAGDADADVDLTHSTEAILKHGFAPVEQYRSRGNLGPWTDEYGLCASIYYCLTGKVPPDALARLTDDIQPDWAGIPGLAESQRAALEKGMSMRAKDRFGSMKALHEALYGPAVQPVPVTEPVYIPEPPRPEPVPEEPKLVSEAPKPVPKPRAKKNWIPIAAGALAIAAVIGGIAMLGGKDKGEEITLQTQPPVTETLPEETEASTIAEEVTVKEVWEANVMKVDPLACLDIDREQILTVTFLDTLADAPDNAIDVSKDGNGSVKAWVTNLDVTIAAEGGINGRIGCYNLFENCKNLKTVTFGEAFHTQYTVSMEGMFHRCHKLEQVDAQSLVTGNVKYMKAVFYQCESLKNLDVSRWDVSNVTDMAYMFVNCWNLQALDVGSWDVSNVTDMGYMFSWCNRLQTLDVGSWDVSNVTNMGSMFSGVSWLLQPDISRWDVSNVTFCADFFSDERMINGKHWQDIFTEQVNNSIVLALTKTDITLGVYLSFQLELQNGLSPNDVEWSSDHPDIVSVSEDGVIIALKSGIATITAKYGSQTATVKVRVP